MRSAKFATPIQKLSCIPWDYEASSAVWNRDFGWIDRRKVSRGDFVDLWNLLQTPGEGAVCSHSLVHLE